MVQPHAGDVDLVGIQPAEWTIMRGYTIGPSHNDTISTSLWSTTACETRLTGFV